MAGLHVLRRIVPLLAKQSLSARLFSSVVANRGGLSFQSTNLQQVHRSLATAEPAFECINIQDEKDFKKYVVDSKKPVVVDFHASWCGSCKLLGPKLEAVLSKMDGNVVLAKVDIDDNTELAMQYGVQSVPTVIGMKNGEKKDSFIGLQEDDIIETFVEKLCH